MLIYATRNILQSQLLTFFRSDGSIGSYLNETIELGDTMHAANTLIIICLGASLFKVTLIFRLHLIELHTL